MRPTQDPRASLLDDSPIPPSGFIKLLKDWLDLERAIRSDTKHRRFAMSRTQRRRQKDEAATSRRLRAAARARVKARRR